MNGNRKRWWAAAMVVILVAGLVSPVLAEEGKRRFLKIEVTEGGQDTPTVKVNLPLSLVEALMDSVELSEETEGVSIAKGTITVEGNRIDLRKFLDELKQLPPTEFVTIEDGGDRVKIWLE